MRFTCDALVSHADSHFRYVAQLEATVEWMKGPNYKPGTHPALGTRSASVLLSEPTLRAGAEPPVKATRPSCLQGGGGDVGGEGDSFVESASRQVIIVIARGLCGQMQ